MSLKIISGKSEAPIFRNSHWWQGKSNLYGCWSLRSSSTMSTWLSSLKEVRYLQTSLQQIGAEYPHHHRTANPENDCRVPKACPSSKPESFCCHCHGRHPRLYYPTSADNQNQELLPHDKSWTKAPDPQALWSSRYQVDGLTKSVIVAKPICRRFCYLSSGRRLPLTREKWTMTHKLWVMLFGYIFESLLCFRNR